MPGKDRTALQTPAQDAWRMFERNVLDPLEQVERAERFDEITGGARLYRVPLQYFVFDAGEHDDVAVAW